MSSLVLIRHGQASFFAEDYDKLSPLGEEQARALGQFWSRTGVAFDEILTGPRLRQKKTTELVVESLRAAQVPCPQPQESPNFDEHQLEQLLRCHRHQLPLPGLEAWKEEQTNNPVNVQRSFYRLLDAAGELWLQAGAGTEVIESWKDFRTRVTDGLRQIVQREGHGRRIGVFTSAGVIGVVLQQALGCSDLQAMRLSWRLRNSSLNEFVFSGPRFSVESFNGLPHLPERQLWTYV